MGFLVHLSINSMVGAWIIMSSIDKSTPSGPAKVNIRANTFSIDSISVRLPRISVSLVSDFVKEKFASFDPIVEKLDSKDQTLG